MKRIYLLCAFTLCLSAHATIDLDRLFDMGTWSKAQLEELVAPDTYETAITTLRGKLTTSVEDGVNQWSLDRNNSKQLASAFIAYLLIYVYPIGKTLPIEVARSFGNAADRLWEPVGLIIMEEMGRPFKRAFKASAAPALQAALVTLGVDEEDPSAMKLYTALWLSYSAQSTASDYLTRAYNRALAEFSTIDLTTTSDEIIERVALATWRNENLKNAPEIVLLRKLMTGE